MALIEIRNLTKQYRKGGETITPLDDVSLDIEQGEFISLMGSSGTGKSTLLNLVASIDTPDKGRILVDGTEITALSRSKLAGWRAANLSKRTILSPFLPRTKTLNSLFYYYRSREQNVGSELKSRYEQLIFSTVPIISRGKCQGDKNSELESHGRLSPIRKSLSQTNQRVTSTQRHRIKFLIY